ncbi:MAG TPA: hypothetical protein VEV38_11540 [Candidatus Eremiobacteraceae bacterium]|nr:hypothetical protein [Candidatus Eremiobacteraceae bacterium]
MSVLADDIKAELRELRTLRWRALFRVNRVAHGWIVEDRASGSKVSFHQRKTDAVRAANHVRKLARDGWLPPEVSMDRLVRLRDYFEDRISSLERDLAVNGPFSQRFAKVTRNALDVATAALEQIRKVIAEAEFERRAAP